MVAPPEPLVVLPKQEKEGKKEGKKGPPPGAWTCIGCGNINWPQRQTCNTRTCQAARPAAAAAAAVAEAPAEGEAASEPARCVCIARLLAL